MNKCLNDAKMMNFCLKQYGTEKLGMLKSIMLHTPKDSLNIINKTNYKYYLFNS